MPCRRQSRESAGAGTLLLENRADSGMLRRREERNEQWQPIDRLPENLDKGAAAEGRATSPRRSTLEKKTEKVDNLMDILLRPRALVACVATQCKAWVPGKPSAPFDCPGILAS